MSKLKVAIVLLYNRDKELLIAKRAKDSKSFAGYWEFVGGKVEEGEGANQAVIRELVEEVDLMLNIGEIKFLASKDYVYNSPLFANCRAGSNLGSLKTISTEINLNLFASDITNKKFKNKEHQELKMIKFSELENYKMPPANKLFLDIINDFLS